MRVLLINPHYPISETPSPPLGLAFLAAALTSAGAEVKVLDFVVFPYRRDAIVETIATFQPQLAGVTAVTMNVTAAKKIIQDLKYSRPELVTVMGGPHSTFCAEPLLEELPELDVVVLGEGEDTIVELAQAVNRQRPFSRIKGIVYRHNGILQTTPARPVTRFDKLPKPARHLLPLGRYRALGMPISITTSRGCPYQCTFCVGHKMGGKTVRFRPADQVVDELEEIRTFKFHQVNLADDLFTANRHHCLAVCAAIINRGLKLRWTAFARVDTVSEDILTAMKAAGCVGISFGVESANPGILKNIKKGITPEQVEAAVRLCVQVGINPQASFILGLPGETPETLRETRSFAKHLQKQGLAYGFHLLAPFPGTEIRRRHRQLGLKILTDDWDRYHANRAIVETETVCQNMLDRLAIEWETEYHSYLTDIERRMHKGLATDQEKAEVNNLKRICLRYDLMMTGALERLNPTPNSSSRSPDQTLMDMAHELSRHVTYDTQEIATDLKTCLQEGHMQWLGHQNGRRLAWVDDLSNRHI